MFHVHFGATTDLLASEAIAKVHEDFWKSEPTNLAGFGKGISVSPEGTDKTSTTVQNRVSHLRGCCGA